MLWMPCKLYQGCYAVVELSHGGYISGVVDDLDDDTVVIQDGNIATHVRREFINDCHAS